MHYYKFHKTPHTYNKLGVYEQCGEEGRSFPIFARGKFECFRLFE
jgi:hypothetical protein